MAEPKDEKREQPGAKGEPKGETDLDKAARRGRLGYSSATAVRK